MQYSPRRRDKADNTWALADATAHRRLMRLIRCEKKSLQSLDSVFYSWISLPAFAAFSRCYQELLWRSAPPFLSPGFIIIPVTAAGFCGASNFSSFFNFLLFLFIFFSNSFGYFAFSLVSFCSSKSPAHLWLTFPVSAQSKLLFLDAGWATRFQKAPIGLFFSWANPVCESFVTSGPCSARSRERPKINVGKFSDQSKL